MNKIYTSGNYVIVEVDGEVSSFPKSSSEYRIASDHFSLVKCPDMYDQQISFKNIGDWFDETGTVPFTVGTIETFLRENTAASSSGGDTTSAAPGATEATLQAVLTAIGDFNTTLASDTNTLIQTISDNTVAQNALITATNTLISDVRGDLATINTTNQDVEGQLIDVNLELDSITTAIGDIDVDNTGFYADLLAQQAAIETILNDTEVLSTSHGVKLDTLISQTSQLETLLNNIVTSIQAGSTTNAASLEQLRLLLADIDANTDAVESELVNIIGEHDQTQVLLTNLITVLNGVQTTLAGSERVIDAVSSLVDGSTDAGVQSVSILFRGNGGSLNGVPVSENFSFSFEPNKGEDTVGSINYTVPTDLEQRVIITYVR